MGEGQKQTPLPLGKGQETLPGPGSCSDTKHRSATAGGRKGRVPTLDTRQYLAATEGRSRNVDKVPSLRSRCRRSA